MVTALGGRASALKDTKVPASDHALMAQVTRFGIQPGIRQELNAADQRFRKRHPPKLLFRLTGRSTYFSAYSSMALNQYKALDYWRARGVRTDSAPPQGTK
jgi:hypothetical protein